MSVFLVVVAVWGMAYKGGQETPAFVKEMPNMATCQAVGEAIVRMTSGETWGPSKYECVEVKP